MMQTTLYLSNFLAGMISIFINATILTLTNHRTQVIRTEIHGFQQNVSTSFCITTEDTDLKKKSVEKEVMLMFLVSFIPLVGFSMLFFEFLHLLHIQKEFKKIEEIRKAVKQKKLDVLERELCKIPGIGFQLGTIKNCLYTLHESHFHASIVEQGYETLLELVEKSFVQGQLTERSKVRIRESVNELSKLTQELVLKSSEQQTKVIMDLQQSLDSNFDKFDSVIKSIRADLENNRAVFQ